MSKLLIISCHLNGGCFQYSNEIIRYMKIPADIYVPKKTAEYSMLENVRTHTFLLWGYPTWQRYLSLLWLMIKFFILGRMGYYHSMLLFGYAGWDYFFTKVWRLTGRRSFFVVHDGKMHDGEDNSKEQDRICYIMRSATNLIFLSEYVHNIVKKSFHIDKPYHIAPHGLISYGHIQHHQQQEKPTILFLGRVSKYKGIDTLLDAMQYVSPDCYLKLIIAGRWENNIEVVTSTDRIEIVNKYLSNDEILHYIEISDIMVFPYHEATQSGVATLAINYLKPSIVTNVGAFKEQFTDKSAVFIQPDNPVLLAKAIQELCENLTKRKEMVEAVKQERNKFEWSSIAKDLDMYIAQQLKNEPANNYSVRS